MPILEKGTDNAKDAMAKCREAKKAKRLNKNNQENSTIMFGGKVNEIQTEVKKDIEKKILKKDKDDKDDKDKPNIKLEVETKPKPPPDNNADMKALIYELQQQIIDVAKDVDYLLMK